MIRKKNSYSQFFLFIFIILIFYSQNLVISVTDIDAINYIEGALSIINGNGYKDLNSNSITHWPPGYSYLLSFFFKSPLYNSYIINGVSLAICSVFIFNLLLKFKWDFFVSLSIVSFLTFGFLYSISIFAKPDIFSYAIFFIAIRLYISKLFYKQIFALILLCFLIFFKSIAVAFFPSFLIAKFINNNFKFSKQEILSFILLSLLYFLVISIVLKNSLEISGSLISDTHPDPTFIKFLAEIKRFIYDFFRMFLFNWYGSIKVSKFIISLLILSIALSIFCFKDLFFKRNILTDIALIIFLLIWLMQFIKIFHATPRLMAYSFIVFIIGCNIHYINIKKWSLLMLMSFSSLIFQNQIVSHYGINHPQYKKIVIEISPHIPKNHTIYTNALKIFDIQNIKTITSSKWPVSKKNTCLIKVDIKNFDNLLNVIYKFDDQNIDWFLIKKINNAELYCNIK